MNNGENFTRLNKYLANVGVLSRRKIDQMIENGEILINGKVAKLGDKIDTTKDRITINGKEVVENKDFKYIALYKPRGVVSTVSDEHGRKTVIDLIQSDDRVYPVGRLDADSTGLILITNDGELTNRLTHPKFHIPKKYIVTVSGKITPKKLEILRAGVRLKDGITKRCEVTPIWESPKRTTLEFIITEGKNRQIRRMCSAVNLEVENLTRISIGPVQLGELTPGENRDLTPLELDNLFAVSFSEQKETP